MGRLLRFARLLLLTIFTVTLVPAFGAVAAGSSAVHHEYAYDAVPSVTTWHDPWTSADVVLALALGPTIENASYWLRVTSGGRVTTPKELVATNTPGTGGNTAVGPGKLTQSEFDRLQTIADEFGTDIHVGGSRAAGEGRNIDTNLPFGKDPAGAPGSTRSDIDVIIDGQVEIDTRGAITDAIKDRVPGAQIASTRGHPNSGEPSLTIRGRR